MNCDHVFDILTRGPFPTGHSSDMDVEMHLQNCGDCRRLAEALRPAVELFEESIAPHETHDLPGYWGLLSEELRTPTPAAAEVPETKNRLISLVSPRASRGGGPPRSQRAEVDHQVFNRDLFRLALAVLVGVAVGGLFRVAGSAGTPAASSKVANATSLETQAPSFALHDSSPALPTTSLAKQWGLPDACLAKLEPAEASPSDHAVSLAVANGNLHCCTNCHHAGQPTTAASPIRAAALLNRCGTCHEG